MRTITHAENCEMSVVEASFNCTCGASRDATRVSVLGGEKAVSAWGDAIRALHTFARASDCPLGVDVTKWFADKTTELSRAQRDPFLGGQDK